MTEIPDPNHIDVETSFIPRDNEQTLGRLFTMCRAELSAFRTDHEAQGDPEVEVSETIEDPTLDVLLVSESAEHVALKIRDADGTMRTLLEGSFPLDGKPVVKAVDRDQKTSEARADDAGILIAGDLLYEITRVNQRRIEDRFENPSTM